MKNIIELILVFIGTIIYFGTAFYFRINDLQVSSKLSGTIIFITFSFYSIAMLMKTLKNRKKNINKNLFISKLLAVLTFFIVSLITLIMRFI
jgi:hypothetical protein